MEDNSKIVKDIEETLRYLKTGSNVNLIVTIESRKEVLCDALNAYESGLRETRETYWKNVGAHPKLDSIDNAITVAQSLKKEFCATRSG